MGVTDDFSFNGTMYRCFLEQRYRESIYKKPIAEIRKPFDLIHLNIAKSSLTTNTARNAREEHATFTTRGRTKGLRRVQEHEVVCYLRKSYEKKVKTTNYNRVKP